MRNFATILNAVIIAANENPDGFTLNINNCEFAQSGFAIALEDTQNSFDHDGMIKVIDYCLKNNIDYINGWYNSENERFYFDATVIIQDRAKAIEFGRINKQIAIFDLDNLEEIKL